MDRLTTELRKPGSAVVVALDSDKALVTLEGEGVATVTLGSCPRNSIMFAPFVSFWQGQLCRNAKSFAFNALVHRLADGSLKQDADCPWLFIDYDAPVVNWMTDGIAGHQVLEVCDDGSVLDHTIDTDHDGIFTVALKDAPRIKVSGVVEEYDDHTAFGGYVALVTLHAGDKPKELPYLMAYDLPDIPDLMRRALEEYPAVKPAIQTFHVFEDTFPDEIGF